LTGKVYYLFSEYLDFSGGWGTWKPMWMTGATLKGSTVGVIGFGRIGNTINSSYYRYPQDQNLVSAIAQVCNNGS